MTDDPRRELTHGYINLTDHFEKLWIEREKRLDDRFEAQKEAIAKSKEELERRLEALNELRRAVEKDRVQFVKVETYDIKTLWYDEWVRGVDKRLISQDTRYATWIIALGIFFSVLQVSMRFLQG